MRIGIVSRVSASTPVDIRVLAAANRGLGFVWLLRQYFTIMRWYNTTARDVANIPIMEMSMAVKIDPLGGGGVSMLSMSHYENYLEIWRVAFLLTLGVFLFHKSLVLTGACAWPTEE